MAPKLPAQSTSTVTYNNNPAVTAAIVVDNVVIDGVVVPDPNQVNPGMNSVFCS